MIWLPRWKCSSSSAILHAAALEFVHQPHEFRHGQTELRTLAAGFEPAPGAARRELHAHGETRHLIRAVGERHQLFELGVLLDDRQHPLAEQLRRQDQRQDDVIFHAVAQQQPVVADVRQRCDQFRLRTAFEAEPIRFAGVEHFLDHFVQLVDLDRIDRLVRTAVPRIGNRGVERFHQPPHSGAQNVLKTHQHRRRDVAARGGLHDFENVDRQIFVEQRSNRRVARFIDEIETVAPRAYRVQFLRALYGPWRCMGSRGTILDRHSLLPCLTGRVRSRTPAVRRCSRPIR